ncbi:hypothetical protein SAMN06298216_4301 [Spirosomataceae bacterium TFI 002]|nr:hypothetical protein SAMN06298216_4301 [Spirosomataceae bacterium TFI 002]
MRTKNLQKAASLALVLISLAFNSFGQSEITIKPIYNPSTINLKVSSAGILLSSGKTIEKHNADIQIDAFADSDYDRVPLTIPNFTVDLVRNGKLISTTNISQNGYIADLLNIAEEGDVVNFRAQEVFLEKESKLELFANGTVWFAFEFVNDEKLVSNK